MHLDDLTSPELIFPDLPGSDVPTVLRAFADRIHQAGRVDDADDLYRRLTEREKLGSTGLGDGVAIPHCKLDGIDEVFLAIGICRRDVEFAAADDEPVHVFFLIVSPEDRPAAHLKALAEVSRWLKSDDHVEEILQLGDAEAIYDLLRAHQSQDVR